MNSDLQRLHRYPFEKLRALFADVTPPALTPIALSIGEPKHLSPPFVQEALQNALHYLANYPTTKGLPELREAIAQWARQRFALNGLDADTQILPVNGTREALFAFAQAVVDRDTDPDHTPLVITPNPFYQIYEGAAILAGAEPYFLSCDASNGFIPNFAAVSESVWKRCQLIYLCSPGNPTGAVIPQSTLAQLVALSDKYDFIIASDECYSEIYGNEANPPVGLLEVCAKLGRHDYKNCVVFHSLSKRSNLPGLRSGFVAGDANILSHFLLYRTYHGCALPIQHQLASIAAWSDEKHVQHNRELYREKFDAVLDILGNTLDIQRPEASFYLWPTVPGDDTVFAKQLFQETHITVLPGQYLSRTIDGTNPGQGRVRMALVATVDECVEAAKRIKKFVEQS